MVRFYKTIIKLISMIDWVKIDHSYKNNKNGIYLDQIVYKLDMIKYVQIKNYSKHLLI